MSSKYNEDDELRSPFLSDELFVAESERDELGAFPAVNFESPFLDRELEREDFVSDVEATESEAEEREDPPVIAGAIPAGPLNTNCQDIGFYGVLGRKRSAGRTTMVPYQWVCHLWIRWRGPGGSKRESGGTGILISPKHVLTAAKWVKWAARDNRNQWLDYEPDSILVSPARNEGSPLSNTYAKRWLLAPNWKPRNPVISENYAVLELEKSLGDMSFDSLRTRKLLFWGSREAKSAIRVLPYTELQGRGVFTAGYGAGRDGTRMLTSRGSLTHTNPGATMRLSAADTWPGLAGGPVGYRVGDEYYLVGMMLDGNLALRMSEQVCKTLAQLVSDPALPCSTKPLIQKETEDELAQSEHKCACGRGASFEAEADPFEPSAFELETTDEEERSSSFEVALADDANEEAPEIEWAPAHEAEDSISEAESWPETVEEARTWSEPDEIKTGGELFGRDYESSDEERPAEEADESFEIVSLEPESGGMPEGDPALLSEEEQPRQGRRVKARILWPALGFPSVIAPGQAASTGQATRQISVLLLTNQNRLTPQEAAEYLRYVSWAERGRRHIPAGERGSFPAKELSVIVPKTSMTAPNPSQASLVQFGASDDSRITASLADAVKKVYAKEGMTYLFEVRVSESASATLADGLYHLFWNNETTAEKAPSDEMALLLRTFARPRRQKLGKLWTTHGSYLMDEYEYEYGALHRPYCSSSRTRVRAEILHPLFVERAGFPHLKVGHLTDLHVDVRADAYEDNVRAREAELKPKMGPGPLNDSELGLYQALGIYNNWNKSVSALYNDAAQNSSVLFLTGDLVDYGRGHWGQDAAAHLQDDDLYNHDRNWFLFSSLIASGKSYKRPVYTILGNHDWRVNPYPPFATGAPSSSNFFYKERPRLASADSEKALAEKLQKHADDALRAAHGDGYGKAISYHRVPEGNLLQKVKKFATVARAVASLFFQTQTLNVKHTPAETTVESVEWYLLAINPFFDYSFTLPNRHRVLMLDWAEKENVLFPIVGRGEKYPYLIWQADTASDPGPKARACLTPLQESLVGMFVKIPGPSKLIGVHAPPIGPYPDWSDQDLLQGRKVYPKDKLFTAAGLTTFATKKGDVIQNWNGHPIFATSPKNGKAGMTADYGSIETKRDWFVKIVGTSPASVRAVFSGHIHRNGLYVVRLIGKETGPTLEGERLVYAVPPEAVSSAPAPAVAHNPNAKIGPLYVNTTCAGPNGNFHPKEDEGAKVYPGYARVQIASDGTIQSAEFRKLAAPASSTVVTAQGSTASGRIAV